MIKIMDFLREHDHLRLSLQHLDIIGGGWEIKIYNTTWSYMEPVFTYFITDDEIDNLNIDFETVIMTLIINWWDESNSVTKKKEKER